MNAIGRIYERDVSRDHPHDLMLPVMLIDLRKTIDIDRVDGASCVMLIIG